jgi:hypothetical protein
MLPNRACAAYAGERFRLNKAVGECVGTAARDAGTERGVAGRLRPIVTCRS